jgi:hypothetical protein
MLEEFRKIRLASLDIKANDGQYSIINDYLIILILNLTVLLTLKNAIVIERLGK